MTKRRDYYQFEKNVLYLCKEYVDVESRSYDTIRETVAVFSTREHKYAFMKHWGTADDEYVLNVDD